VTGQRVPLTPDPRRRVDLRCCDFDRLVDVDLALGRHVRDVLVADNLAAFLPDPTPETIAAARMCSGILIAGRAAKARRLAEIRIAWLTPGETAP
jgi:hypothetical protein